MGGSTTYKGIEDDLLAHGATHPETPPTLCLSCPTRGGFAGRPVGAYGFTVENTSDTRIGYQYVK